VNEHKCRQLVYERSEQVCERCCRNGPYLSVHHRLKRGQGGGWTPQNCVLLCGTGTSGCGAYVVIAYQQQRLEGDERNMRAARRQLELFMDDGIRERVTVALALLDESVDGRNEAWFDFTEQRGQ